MSELEHRVVQSAITAWHRGEEILSHGIKNRGANDEIVESASEGEIYMQRTAAVCPSLLPVEAEEVDVFWSTGSWNPRHWVSDESMTERMAES
jgi:hypothetical protein